jgi:hypothetical protein
MLRLAWIARITLARRSSVTICISEPATRLLFSPGKCDVPQPVASYAVKTYLKITFGETLYRVQSLH